jgi:neutral ceramidase
MKIRRLFTYAGFITATTICWAASGWAQLRVGTGKVEVTPDAANLPSPFLSIHDPLFTRAILIDNGKTRALLMNLDVGKISQNLYSKLSAEISKRYGVPADNIVMSAVHDHASVPELGGGQPGGQPQQGGPGGGARPQAGPGGAPQASSAMQAFAEKAYKGMLQAVEQAQASLQPAEMGYGEGKLYLNVNRDAIDPKTRQWAEKPNLDFPSDKTLYVIEFRKPNGGDPIAVYMSYAMHSITMFLRREISGDFPEVAIRTRSTYARSGRLVPSRRRPRLIPTILPTRTRPDSGSSEAARNSRPCHSIRSWPSKPGKWFRPSAFSRRRKPCA